MLDLSQNKKIAISAVAVFMVSFSVMLAFLEKHQLTAESSHASVINVTKVIEDSI